MGQGGCVTAHPGLTAALGGAISFQFYLSWTRPINFVSTKASYTDRRTDVYILILTLVLNRSMPATMVTAEFTSKENCEDAANAWKMQAKVTFNNALVATVCKPK